MPTSRGDFCALLFFSAAVLCAWNPEPLPMRDWFNGFLESAVGWCR